jgi:hypothetical protein
MLTGTGYYTSVNDIHANPTAAELSKINVGDYSYLDYNSDGIISALDKFAIKGSNYPNITYSFSGGLSYKNFSLNVLFQGNAGKYIDFNGCFENEFRKGNWRVHDSQVDYWTPVNSDASHATLHYSSSGLITNMVWAGLDGDGGFAMMIPGKLWRNCDYLRLKEIYAGYSFQSGFMKKSAGISSCMIFVTANNLLTLTRLPEVDPEPLTYAIGTGNTGGFYPQLSNIKLGLKFDF